MGILFLTYGEIDIDKIGSIVGTIKKYVCNNEKIKFHLWHDLNIKIDEDTQKSDCNVDELINKFSECKNLCIADQLSFMDNKNVEDSIFDHFMKMIDNMENKATNLPDDEAAVLLFDNFNMYQVMFANIYNTKKFYNRVIELYKNNKIVLAITYASRNIYNDWYLISKILTLRVLRDDAGNKYNNQQRKLQLTLGTDFDENNPEQESLNFIVAETGDVCSVKKKYYNCPGMGLSDRDQQSGRKSMCMTNTKQTNTAKKKHTLYNTYLGSIDKIRHVIDEITGEIYPVIENNKNVVALCANCCFSAIKPGMSITKSGEYVYPFYSLKYETSSSDC
ncbi:MAG: hypothetical protein KDH96_09820, partial [Candidatus Riesia sp.]|nr:hypothetical protein [Candidatus Riesia sp.]